MILDQTIPEPSTLLPHHRLHQFHRIHKAAGNNVIQNLSSKGNGTSLCKSGKVENHCPDPLSSR
jgi:hypothetical protein